MSIENCYKTNNNQFAKLKKNNTDGISTLHCRTNQNGNCSFFPMKQSCNTFNGPEKLLDCSYNMHNAESDCNKIYQNKCINIGENKFYKIYGIEDGLFMHCKKDISNCVNYDPLGKCVNYDVSGKCVKYEPSGKCLKYDLSGKCVKYDLSTCLIYDLSTCKIYDTSSQCINDITPTGIFSCSERDIATQGHWCNISNLSFLSAETLSVPADCEKFLKDVVDPKQEEDDVNESLKKLKAINEYTLMFLSALKDELPMLIGTMVTEEVIERLIKKASKKAAQVVVKTLVSKALAIGVKALAIAMSAYTIVTTLEAIVSITRAASGTPLQIYIDREIVDKIWDEIYKSVTDRVNNDEQVNCLRTYLKKQLAKKGRDFSQSQIEELLKGATAIYQVVQPIEIITTKNISAYFRCKNSTDSSGNINIDSGNPCWCNLDQFKDLPEASSYDLSGRTLSIGFPDISADYYYKEGFYKYLNSTFGIPSGGIPPPEWNNDIAPYVTTNCNNGEYTQCLEGNEYECRRCLVNVRRESSIVDNDFISNVCKKEEDIVECLQQDLSGNCISCIRRIVGSFNPYVENKNDYKNINNKLVNIILYTIIIFCIILLYFLLFRKQ